MVAAMERIGKAATISAAMEYASYGWRVIPVDPKTKVPPLSAWQELATTSEDQIIEWWDGKYQVYGVGVQFGPRSGIFDVEVESPDDEPKLRDAFGGEIPPTPTFRSKRGGLHRIFRYSAELADIFKKANPSLGDFGINGDLKIGYEDRGSQSVFPPSAGRKWLDGLAPSQIEPAEIPDEFIAFLANGAGLSSAGGSSGKSQAQWAKITNGSAEGSRNNDMASFIGMQARMCADLDSKQNLQFVLECARGQKQLNQPPMPDAEVVAVFKSIVAKEQLSRASQVFAATVRAPERDAGGGQELSFRLVIINDTPRRFELYAPQWEGCIVVTGDQLADWAKLRVAIIDQAGCAVPSGRTFTDSWQRQGGILEQLLATAETRDPPPEERREAVVAQRAYEHLSGRRNVMLTACGWPADLGDKGVAFAFTAVWEFCVNSADRITRGELSRVLDRCGMVEYRPGAGEVRGKGRPKFKRLSLDGLERLRKLAYPGPDDSSPDESNCPLYMGKFSRVSPRTQGTERTFDAYQ